MTNHVHMFDGEHASVTVLTDAPGYGVLVAVHGVSGLPIHESKPMGQAPFNHGRVLAHLAARHAHANGAIAYATWLGPVYTADELEAVTLELV